MKKIYFSYLGKTYLFEMTREAFKSHSEFDYERESLSEDSDYNTIIVNVRLKKFDLFNFIKECLKSDADKEVLTKVRKDLMVLLFPLQIGSCVSAHGEADYYGETIVKELNEHEISYEVIKEMLESTFEKVEIL